MSKTCYIFTGGEVYSLRNKPGEDDRIIAADSGYNTARRFGVEPHLLVGDLDSLDRSLLGEGELDKIEKIIVSPIKNDTDTKLAADIAVSGGADKIIIIGGLGGRVDHTLSNLFLLEYISEMGISCFLSDGKNRVRAMVADKREEKLQITREYKYLSIISLSDECRGVSVRGGRYPLDGATITRKHSYAVSNEITAEYGEITLFDGRMLVIESCD